MAKRKANQSGPKIKKLEFGEIGSTGLNQSAGMIFEEKLKRLQGERGKLTYMEMAENDATVSSILFIIDALIKQVEWRVTPFDGSESSIASAQFLESVMEDMEHPFEDVISEIMTMLVMGFAPLETVYKRRLGFQGLQLKKPSEKRRPSSRFSDGMIGWAKLPLRAQETIHEWKISDNGDIEGFFQIAPPKWERVFIPIEKALLFRTTVRKNNPEGHSIIRNAYRSWYFKKKIENIEGIGIERDLAGLPMAMVPANIMQDDASDQEKAIFAQVKRIVTNVRRDEQEGIVFPSLRDKDGNQLYDFKLLSTGGARQFKTNEIIQRYRQDIALTVVADFILLGHQKTGTFSVADSKTKIFSMALKAWLNAIASVFNRKAIPTLFMVNGLPTEELPQLTFGDIETVDLNELSNYINALTGASIDLTSENISNYLKSQGNLPLDEQEGV